MTMLTVDGEYTFHVGESFSSYDELENRMAQHSAESFVCYWRRDTRTVQGAYMKTSRPIAQCLKYYSVRFACVYGGQKFRSRGKGCRQTQSMRTNCPSFIMLRASKCGQKLEVIAVCNEHNHEISELVAKGLPQNRKLPDKIRDDVLKMLAKHIDRRLIIEYVQKTTNKCLTQKDLHNLKTAYKHIIARMIDRGEIDLNESGDFNIDHQFDQATEIEWDNSSSCGFSYQIQIDDMHPKVEIDDDEEQLPENHLDMQLNKSDNNIDESDDVTEANPLIDPILFDDDELGDDNSQNKVYSIHDQNYDESFYIVEEPCIDDDVSNHSINIVVQHEIVSNDCIELSATPSSPPATSQSSVSSRPPAPPCEDNISTQPRPTSSKHFTKIRKPIRRSIVKKRNARRVHLGRCMHCNSKLIKMQIEVLEAQKQKLLEETCILQLTKEKLLAEIYHQPKLH